MKIDVFKYESAFELFSDLIEQLRNTGQYSNRQFAKAAGFSTHSLVPMILSGSRRLTKQNGVKISNALRMSKAEQAYFLALIERESAETSQEKIRSEERLKRLENQRRLERQKGGSLIFSNPRANQLLQLFPSVWVQPDVNEISKRTGWSSSEIQAAIRFLIEQGLIQTRNSLFRKVPQGYQESSQPDQDKLQFMKKCLEETKTDRQSYSFFISVDQESMPKLRAKIHSFVKELQEVFYTDRPHKKQCYVLNLDFLHQIDFDGCADERKIADDPHLENSQIGEEL